VIALVVNEMKKIGKIKSIPLQDHLNLLALLNESVGVQPGLRIRKICCHGFTLNGGMPFPTWKKPPFSRFLERKRQKRKDPSVKSMHLPRKKRMGGRISSITWGAMKM